MTLRGRKPRQPQSLRQPAERSVCQRSSCLSSLTLSTGSAVVGFFSVAAIDEYASFARPKSAQPPCGIARTDGSQIVQLATDKSKSKLSNSSSVFFAVGVIALGCCACRKLNPVGMGLRIGRRWPMRDLVRLIWALVVDLFRSRARAGSRGSGAAPADRRVAQRQASPTIYAGHRQVGAGMALLAVSKTRVTRWR